MSPKDENTGLSSNERTGIEWVGNRNTSLRPAEIF